MIINAFIQARLTSTRLPGKVMRPILGVPMILHQISRLKKAMLIDNIVLLTSSDASDDVLVEYCIKNNVNYFRGDLNDVLARYTNALTDFPCDHLVRITGDCPLLDWDVVDLVIEEHLNSKSDYTSNVLPATFPDGLDVEVISSKCLKDIETKAKESYEREHVTYFCYQHPELYKIHNVTNSNGDESDMRWTVDQVEDFEFIQAIYKELYKGVPFPVSAVRTLLELNPDLSKNNCNILRNEGLIKSILEAEE